MPGAPYRKLPHREIDALTLGSMASHMVAHEAKFGRISFKQPRAKRRCEEVAQ